MTTENRPLSPHLQVYRWQITMLMSITHRGTGIALAAGLLLLVWWIAAAAAGPEAFAIVQDFMGSWVGRLMLFGWTLAVFYHLCNGIRHLFWDIGRGFELTSVYASGWVVIVASLVLTGLAWVWGYNTMGAL